MNANALKEKRIGVMVHFSAGSFAGTVEWCNTPKSQVSYNRVIGRHGEIAHVVPEHLRAWHAGACKPSDPRLLYTDANSAFEGIALSGGPKDGPPTPMQRKRLVQLIRERFQANGWPLTETWRIVGHDTEAIWTQQNAPDRPHLWGKRGRKDDPTGPKKHTPWLDLNAIRAEVARESAQ